MEELHGIIVGLKAYSGNGHELLKKSVQQLTEIMEILSLSSIYKVQGKIISSGGIHDLRSEESFSGLAMAVKAVAKHTPQVLLSRFEEIEFSLRSEVLHRSVSINLLAFESRVQFTPQLTLPHPQLHTHPEYLVPAAEVWGDFLHPVTKESLTALAKRLDEDSWGEFYAQGKSLLDF